MKMLEKRVNNYFSSDKDINIKVINSQLLALCSFCFINLIFQLFIDYNFNYTIFSFMYLLINIFFLIYINNRKEIKKYQLLMLVVNVIYLSFFYLYGGGFSHCVYYYFLPSIILTFILIRFSKNQKKFFLGLEIIAYSLVIIIDFLEHGSIIDEQKFMILNMVTLLILSISLGLSFYAILQINGRQRLELQKLNKYLKKISIIDSLTGVWNRKYMEEKLEELKNSNNLSVVMFDIDHFKEINDLYGHQEGDNILKEIAKTINSCLRYDDILTRYGGEEFLLILPNTLDSTAYILANKIRKKIMNSVKAGNDNKKVTISGGVAALKNFDNVEEMIKCADDNLYYAKEHGRNKICINKVK